MRTIPEPAGYMGRDLVNRALVERKLAYQALADECRAYSQAGHQAALDDEIERRFGRR